MKKEDIMVKPKKGLELEIRPLNVDDVFTVAKMLGKISKSALEEIAEALTREIREEGIEEVEEGEMEVDAKKGVNPTRLGMVIISSVFLEAEEDLKAWLGDLIGHSAEEFGAMPANTVLDVIEGLVSQEGIRDFFARASQLATKIIDRS